MSIVRATVQVTSLDSRARARSRPREQSTNVQPAVHTRGGGARAVAKSSYTARLQSTCYTRGSSRRPRPRALGAFASACTARQRMVCLPRCGRLFDDKKTTLRLVILPRSCKSHSSTCTRGRCCHRSVPSSCSSASRSTTCGCIVPLQDHRVSMAIRAHTPALTAAQIGRRVITTTSR